MEALTYTNFFFKDRENGQDLNISIRSEAPDTTEERAFNKVGTFSNRSTSSLSAIGQKLPKLGKITYFVYFY